MAMLVITTGYLYPFYYETLSHENLHENYQENQPIATKPFTEYR